MDLPDDPHIGTVISGYRIEAGIGRGGMGVEDSSPEVSADKVEQDTARTPGYQRLSFESTTLNGREAFEWTFQIGSERRR